MINYDDLLGLPFADRGRGPDQYDCWGLVREVYKRHGISLPDYPISAADAVKIGNQMELDKPDWIEISEPVAPCLVVIQLSDASWANHAGVYIGNGQFIHAYSKTGVVVDRLKKWRTYIVGFYVPR